MLLWAPGDAIYRWKYGGKIKINCMKVSVGMRAATGVGGDWLVFTPPVESAQTTSAQTL